MMRSRKNGLVRLGLTAAVLGVIWLHVLPWVAVQPGMAAHLKSLEEQGIDPSAMFYTELDAMEPVLRRLEQR